LLLREFFVAVGETSERRLLGRGIPLKLDAGVGVSGVGRWGFALLGVAIKCDVLDVDGPLG